MALKDVIFYPVGGQPSKDKLRSKITVVGIGAVGMAAVYTMLVQGTTSELALVDVAEDRVKGEVMDLSHGQLFLSNTVISGSSDYKVSANSNIVVICAGVRQKDGESRLNLVQRNVDLFKIMVPQIIKNSPNCIIVVVSNPVDILAYVTWKISGFPRNRVLGTGTMLDSARFRHLLASKLGLSTSSVHGYILGEHGDHSVPIWSTLNIAGCKMKEMLPKLGAPDDPDHFHDIYKQVVNSAYHIIKCKGYTSWGIGSTVNALCNDILKNKKSVHALSTYVKHDGNIPSLNSIDKDIYMSLPCVVDDHGISHIVPIKISEEESILLTKCAKVMEEIIRDIKW